MPGSSIAFITGHRGESLRAIERESGTRGAAPDSARPRDFRARARDGSRRGRARARRRARRRPARPTAAARRFCFTDGERNSGKESENLLVFSFSRSARDHAADIIEDRIREHKRMGGRGRGGGGGYRDDRGGGGRGYRDDRRDDRRDYDRGGGRDYDRGGGGRDYDRGGGGRGGPSGPSDGVIREKLIEREKARIAKDYRAADDIRSELGLQGITINDLTRTWTSSDGRSGPRPSAYDDPSYSSKTYDLGGSRGRPEEPRGGGGGSDRGASRSRSRSRGRRRRADDDDDSRKSDDDDDAAPAKEAAPANEGDD